MTETLNHTPLYDWHHSHGAKMAPFAGFEMPISYPSGAVAEIKAVRTKAGLFDISHMGQIFVSGTASREFLNFVTVRDLDPLTPELARYTLACGENGFPIDDLIVYFIRPLGNGEELFLVVSNASNVDKVYRFFTSVRNNYKGYLTAGETLRLSNDSSHYALLALQGPLSEKILSKVSSLEDLPKKNYSCRYATVSGRRVLVMRSGYTGEDGFEILVPNKWAQELWEDLLECGESDGLIPCGLASRDVLRLEAGMPLYGHEIGPDHDPISAGLGRYVDTGKSPFIGQKALEKMKKEHSSPTLHGLTMEKGRVPRAGCDVYDASVGGQKIGSLTSAGPSPTLELNIAMGYLNTPHAIGQEVFVEIGTKRYSAVIAKIPFYKRAKK